MKKKTILSILFWIAVIAAPALACLFVVAQFPPDVEVPLHWNASGQIDRWGSSITMLPASLIMCGANALMGLMYCFSDKLYNMGLVHGVSRKAVRPFLCGTAVVLAAAMVIILVCWAANAQAALS
ncbi:DUF1648 domain-containing protein [Adlercreutzia aquisgranensis]|uniref:DUF1648 domain-containing protein n=1 Tax=Adlercreutzia aquisgranensis TaxID=2941323 RepID=UPI00203C2BB0|nr:DUF1648 domain-containing protein [Adlercreutzia aquisgranensis]